MNIKALIEQAYAAFNKRDIDSALNLMHENVSWPKASEGGRVVGKSDMRAYWSRQWEIFNPRVNVISIEEVGDGRANVKVHQLVKDLDGNVLSDSEVWHEYTVKDGLIERMEIREDASNSGDKPSAAFSQHN